MNKELNEAVITTATKDALAAFNEGATAPWGDGETLPDYRDLFFVDGIGAHREAIENDDALRHEVTSLYDRTFRAEIDRLCAEPEVDPNDVCTDCGADGPHLCPASIPDVG